MDSRHGLLGGQIGKRGVIYLGKDQPPRIRLKHPRYDDRHPLTNQVAGFFNHDRRAVFKVANPLLARIASFRISTTSR